MTGSGPVYRGHGMYEVLARKYRPRFFAELVAGHSDALRRV
jgi:hypothetical protein